MERVPKGIFTHHSSPFWAYNFSENDRDVVAIIALFPALSAFPFHLPDMILIKPYINLCPIIKKINAPRDKNGPNGMAYFVSFPLMSISGMPIITPMREPDMRLNITPLSPQKAPIIPSNLISPSPMPSLFAINR